MLGPSFPQTGHFFYYASLCKITHPHFHIQTNLLIPLNSSPLRSQRTIYSESVFLLFYLLLYANFFIFFNLEICFICEGMLLFIKARTTSS